MAADKGRVIEANAILLDEDLFRLIPKLHVRKLRQWLHGRHVVGQGPGARVESIVPLRCFWLGESRAFLGSWVLDFLFANSKLFKDDDGEKLDSESEGDPQG